MKEQGSGGFLKAGRKIPLTKEKFYRNIILEKRPTVPSDKDSEKHAMTDSYFFCGIGGSGMSALARILVRRGARVGGSDRGFDRGQSPEKFAALAAEGITIHPQDGSGPEGYGVLVVSSAVEDSVPDVRAALALGKPILRRAELLARLFNAARGIAIGGTSGKTTVCAMTGWIFAACGLDPVIVNGGIMRNFEDNARAGAGEWFIAETDESDGSIALYDPEISVLNNVTLDHKPLDELRPLFRDFLARARRGIVLNLDDPESAALAREVPGAVTFGIDTPAAALNAIDLETRPGGSACHVDGMKLLLSVPGRHNISNALAALGAAKLAGIETGAALAALQSFRGTARRLEVLGEADGVTVIDDFAHNPDKIAASLATLREFPGRLIVMFQLHGFGPARLLREGIVEAFAKGLGPEDILIMPEIFYAGGSAERTISAKDLTLDVARAGRAARFFETRDEVAAYLEETARAGDRIAIMGARDDTLSDFGRDILKRLAARRNGS